MDTKYIEFKNGDNSLFKIKFDSVEKKFLIDDLENIQDTPIDSTVSSSIFKLKIYTKGGVLQKTLNIKGTDNLKSVLKKFDGYKYNVEDYIEVWSNTPKNIVIHGVDRDTKPNGSTNGTVQPLHLVHQGKIQLKLHNNHQLEEIIQVKIKNKLQKILQMEVEV